MPDLTAQQVIANVLSDIHGQSLDGEVAVAVAADIIHALKVDRYDIVHRPIPAEERLLAEVRAAVTEAGISQAAICRELGLSQKHMSGMLNGKSPLSLLWAERILAVCGRTLDLKVSGGGADE